MKHYKVTGKAVQYHNCNCHHCIQPVQQSVNVSIVVQVDDNAEDKVILFEALGEQYRALHLIDETDELAWDKEVEPEIREANTDEILAAIDAPRLPGF